MIHILYKTDILDSAPIIVMYLTWILCDFRHNVRIVRIYNLKMSVPSDSILLLERKDRKWKSVKFVS